MEGRLPNKTTNTTQRARMVWMWVGGQSARNIAQETGASVSTVYRWIRRWEQEGNIHTRPRIGKYQMCFWRKKLGGGAPFPSGAYGGVAAGFTPFHHRHYHLQPSSHLQVKERHHLNPGFHDFPLYFAANRK